MKPRGLRLSIAITLILCIATTGCGADEQSICQSASEFQTAVSQIDAEDLANALGPEFWQELDTLLTEISESDSGQIGVLASELQVELRRFVDRLEAVNFNLVAAALDPESATLFIDLANELLEFSSEELGQVVAEECR